MADPYLPPQPGSYDPARAARDPAYTDPNRPVPAANPPRGGFSTGILVALVFVVVAVLAAAFFRPGTPDIEATVPAADVAPDAAPVDPNAATTGEATVQPEADPAIDPAADPATDPAADPALDPAADPAADPTTGTTEPATPPASGSTSP
jgi:hypothetical protein